MHHRSARLAAVLLLLVFAASSPVFACPMCKGQISPEAELKQMAEKMKAEQEVKKQEQLAALIAQKELEMKNRDAQTRGYFWSIIFMLIMPPTLLAILGTSIGVAVKRARVRQAELLGSARQVTT